jgi:hypothetical protein
MDNLFLQAYTDPGLCMTGGNTHSLTEGYTYVNL